MERPLKSSPALGSARRRGVAIDGRDLVVEGPLAEGSTLPRLVRAVADGVDLAAWIEAHRGPIDDALAAHGAVLFRGFAVAGVEGFEGVSQALSRGALLPYVYRSTPRTRVGSANLYTSTEYPSDQEIPLHNENAYAPAWPMKIWFGALVCAETGGETPIADSRRVYRRLSPALRERFAARRVMYVRNYGDLDLPWPVSFQTDDPAEVTAYCRAAGIACEWREGGRLRTRQVLPAVATHPRTGEPVWFNQAHLFHVGALPPAVREALLRTVAEDDLPRNAYYGDGTPIEAGALEEIRAAYLAETVAFPWHAGDVLLLDNMLTAHGRRPYRGERRVLVGMAESCRHDGGAPAA
jgi:alpha-ketoglutarate-dependent taurine dioxygenase